jgi:hypothetical protein
MYALATCRGSILRGTTTDEYGDVADAANIIATGVLASIQETTHRVWDRATQTPRIVRGFGCSMPSTTDIGPDDRFRDDTNGVTYIVVAVTQPGGPAWTSDLEVELKRINGSGTTP